MTKSEQAIRLIIQEGITAAEAADRVGISRAAVSKAKLHPSKTSQNIRKLCEMHGEIEKLTAQRDTLLPDYQAIEQRVDAVIRARFGLPETPSFEVKKADLILLATERRDLMPHDATAWPSISGIIPLERRITAVPAGRACAQFMRRFIEIIQGES